MKLFKFIKVISKILPVHFILDTLYYYYYYHCCCDCDCQYHYQYVYFWFLFNHLFFQR